MNSARLILKALLFFFFFIFVTSEVTKTAGSVVSLSYGYIYFVEKNDRNPKKDFRHLSRNKKKKIRCAFAIVRKTQTPEGF